MFLCLMFLMLSRLFIAASCSPTGKGLSLVVQSHFFTSSDLDVLSLLNVRSVKLDLMVNEEKKQHRFSVNHVHKKALILL